jgi:hypothetical protein
MTPTPHALYFLFALAMLLVAAYSGLLGVLAVVTRRTSGIDVDVAHLCMGVAMSGMFVTALAVGRDGAWEAVFHRYGRHVPHESVHAVMSFAMVLMYWFPQGSTPLGAMAMGTVGANRADPALVLGLAVTVLGSAVFTLANPVKGVSHHGAHARRFVGDGTVEATVVPGVLGVLTAPWMEDASHVVMCVSMAFMLILML